MTNRTLLKRIIIVTITGANLLILYYNYRYIKSPSGTQAPAIVEQPAQSPNINAKVQPTDSPSAEIKEPTGAGSNVQQRQSSASSMAVVRFESGNLTLSPQAQADLVKVFNMMSENPSIKVEVGGYTDNEGNPVRNLKLSVKRAILVKDYLVRLGIPSERVVVQGYGSVNPLADNKTAEGRAQNRRVEVNLLKG
ncbi:MAG: OmpA-OmpF porin, family [Pyrinomonadaceae bacterium]|nr:OmpA-OmpF porin, family [Pyrinomonadaceae bacterium]